jgi:putative ABC transport system permease protein
MRQIIRMCALALRDYRYEGLLSACAVLSLAAVLAPLLIVYGVKFGIVSAMTESLTNDPRTTEISPVTSGEYSLDALQQWRARPDILFLLPRTRSISATMKLAQGTGLERHTVLVSLEPSAEHDPLLTRYGIDFPPTAQQAAQPENTSLPAPSVQGLPEPLSKAQAQAAPPALKAQSAAQADRLGAQQPAPKPQGTAQQSLPPVSVVLSATAAAKLNVQAQAFVQGIVDRKVRGQVQTASVTLQVLAVLPHAAQQKDVAFLPLPLVQATEDYRDGYAVPVFGWAGEERPLSPRAFASFRLYARQLQDVEPLRRFFAAQGIAVYTQAEQIEAIQSLDSSLSLIFSLIVGAAATGFTASTASQAFASVRRKERHLGLLRLAGFSTQALLFFPLAQAACTAFLGMALSFALYGAAAMLIDMLFAASLHGQAVCLLPPLHAACAAAFVFALSLGAAWLPALRAARIEPSEVIRDI